MLAYGPQGGSRAGSGEKEGVPWGTGAWILGREPCPDTGCHASFWLQTLPVSWEPWSPTASACSISLSMGRGCSCFFGSHVRNAGAHGWMPLPILSPGGGVWDTRGRDSCCKNRKPGVPKKREAGLSIPLTVDFTRCHLWFTRHFSSCFPYVISFNPRKHCLA